MATYASIKYDMDLSSNATGAGALTLLATETASSSGTISFTSGIDSTYKEYIFRFYDVHPSADANLTFQVDASTNTNYNASITSTFFWSDHMENDTDAELTYKTDQDQGGGTSFQNIGTTMESGDTDSSAAGILHLYNPSTDTYMVHWKAEVQMRSSGTPSSRYQFTAGYINGTGINKLQFKMSSGNIDAGTFKLYGVL